MKPLLIHNAKIVNEGKIYAASLYLNKGKIEKIFKASVPPQFFISNRIEADGLFLLPGVIDDQVHFRDPGLVRKGDIYTEAKAAIAGGVTSYMEMPNTIPQTTTQDLLEEKYKMAAEKSLANYSFYMGATNDNIEEIEKTDPSKVCGVKVFMGSSTGNMLVDRKESLERIFQNSPVLIATHCEDEGIIRQNMREAKEFHGNDIPIDMHPVIRSEEACYKSTKLAVELAKKYNSRLHVLHISTKKELNLFNHLIPLKDKRITSEVCVHHLWFDSNDYKQYGNKIKWNPAIKKPSDKTGLLQGLLDNKLDIIATDHAPHTIEEKNNEYVRCPSGGPLVQHSLIAMLEMYQNKKITLEKVVEKMCHAPADIFQVDKRGYIREGYWADIVLVNMNRIWTVNKDNILYKCKWSPFEGTIFRSMVKTTIVNGNIVYDNGTFNEKTKGMRLTFNR